MRTMLFFSALLLLGGNCSAQLVDGILGQKRTIAQVLLRPYRIIDYGKERVVHQIDEGINQTVFFENDTCVKFYWAVDTELVDTFKSRLLNEGYVLHELGLRKDSLELSLKPLPSGKSTLFIASISATLAGDRDPSGRPVVVRTTKVVENEPTPLLQQAIMDEEKNRPEQKKHKDPKRHWVGNQDGELRILGWEK